MIELAQSGDTIEARELVKLLGQMLSEQSAGGDPMPPAAAKYLSRALLAIGDGDADSALNLKPKGRPREWPHDAKVLAVDIMVQLINTGLSIDQAAADASSLVNRHVEELKRRLETRSNPIDLISPWRAFVGKPALDTESLEPMKGWYRELNSPPRSSRKARP